jgi:hypothetical protein
MTASSAVYQLCSCICGRICTLLQVRRRHCSALDPCTQAAIVVNGQPRPKCTLAASLDRLSRLCYQCAALPFPC